MVRTAEAVNTGRGRPKNSKGTRSSVAVEKFNYPKEEYVNHENKAINLVWFGKKFREIQKHDGNKHLDHNLAMYCIAKHLPSLPIAKWHLLMSDTKDHDVSKVFNLMRQTYLAIYPVYPEDLEKLETGPEAEGKRDNKRKGWANHVLQYLQKLFTNHKSQGVVYWFLYQLLTMHELSIDKKKAFQIIGGTLGGTTVPYKINTTFSNQQEAQYKLVLPQDLCHLYTGKGLEQDDLRWVSSADALMESAADKAALEETDDQRSSVFWRREIQTCEVEKGNIEDGLKVRKKAVEDAEKELKKIKKKLAEQRQMLTLALDREQLLSQSGTPEEKRQRVLKVKSVVELLEDTRMTDDEVVKIILDMRGSNIGKQSQRPGPSGASKAKTQGKGEQPKIKGSASNDAVASKPKSGVTVENRSNKRKYDDAFKNSGTEPEVVENPPMISKAPAINLGSALVENEASNIDSGLPAAEQEDGNERHDGTETFENIIMDLNDGDPVSEDKVPESCESETPRDGHASEMEDEKDEEELEEEKDKDEQEEEKDGEEQEEGKDGEEQEEGKDGEEQEEGKDGKEQEEDDEDESSDSDEED